MKENPARIRFVSPPVRMRPRSAVVPSTSHGEDVTSPALLWQPIAPGPALQPHQLLVASMGVPRFEASFPTPATELPTIRLKWAWRLPATPPAPTKMPSVEFPVRVLPVALIAWFGLPPTASVTDTPEPLEPETPLPLTARSVLPPDREIPEPVFPVIVLPETTPPWRWRRSIGPSPLLVLPVIETSDE